MADQEKMPLKIENLEVTELEAEDLEDLAGGGNGNCPCFNNACSLDPQETPTTTE